jgi:hypothetical protein
MLFSIAGAEVGTGRCPGFPSSAAVAQAAAQQNRGKAATLQSEPPEGPNRFKIVKSRSRVQVIAEAEQAIAAAKRLVDEQTAIVRRLERTGGCTSIF